ncbi:ABC transporter ATP-binding protein [Streptococcus macacae]|uniref:ATP-binding cassette cobalt transporter n=1 Tax=Streptococcus macacae NCTC 11558 TaxID=764298 RepID=G5JUZ4_9STRE|nr:ABC transporter ATP-binding protein [Streptococcus macacae]EHJ51952.1 ATP-binding cassette cobalt transporter [Streptococcus macacae NCTC 11558]SUN79291.1 cobalt/nickel transport system ATP-binding protein [Streptococcus macacae NCTC 11558]
MTDFITFENFTFKYNAQSESTLKHINLNIKKGNKVLIIGPSGSGKSTLGQCLNGIIPNIYKGTKSGQLTIGGQEVFERSVYDKSELVSTVLQDPDSQFIGLTVAEDIAFALENDCLSQTKMREKVHFWAEKLDLVDLLQQRPQDLSGGQKQRVSLAGVLVDESPILLFDEPLANLDPKSGQDTIDLIDRIHKDNQATTIIIEHRLEDVLYRCVDQVILINEGEILFDGDPDSLLQTSLLAENGIREPLYISILRDLGFKLDKQQHLSQLSQLDLSGLQTKTIGPYQKLSHDYSDLLTLKNVTFSYTKGSPILKDISLIIGKGERISIVGKNGAGKSTLAKAMCQFITADGDIYYHNQSIKEDTVRERAERIGYVLQNPNQMISQTMIFDEVALGLRLRGFDEKMIKERVHETLRTCGLYAFRKWPVSALSFGQKKRVTIASILVLNPEIILLDEPTAGQDQRHYTEIMNFLNQLQKAGHTIIMITHDMQLMMEYSDRSLVIADGKVIADKSPIEVLGNKELLERAHLKTTSIFQLAEKLKISSAALTDFYIHGKRGKQ